MKPQPSKISFAALILLSALLWSIPASVRAATIVVDTPLDSNLLSACTVVPGDCSLRGAITQANSTGGADQINVPAGTYTLTLTGKDDVNATGDLDILDTVTIVGSGGNPNGNAGDTIIQAGTSTSNGIDKVFQINPQFETASATFQALTVRFGRNTYPFNIDQDEFNYLGAGIDFFGGNDPSTTSLTVSNCIVSDNTVANTAFPGAAAGINCDNGNLTISDTLITNNETTAQPGGGVSFFGDARTMTMTNCTVTNNRAKGGADGEGGGIYIRQNSNGTVAIHGCLISNNTSESRAGGIKLEGLGTLNTTIDQGTVITGNISSGAGAGASEGGGVYVSHNSGTTALTNVEISNNTASEAGSPQAHGGGLFSNLGDLTLANTTISGNSAAASGGGVNFATGSPGATLTNVTISNNQADSDGNLTGAGGGISRTGGTVTLRNTIVAGNLGLTADISGTVDSGANAKNNLIGTGGSGGLTNGTNGNIVGVDARIGALANNGGTSAGVAGSTATIQTHALLSGSPAFDNGDATVAAGLTTDARGTGFPRVQDGPDADTIDEVEIGAFEAHPSIENIADQTINEDGSLALPFNIGDANFDDATFDSITATSSNTTLVPNNPANISLSGSGSTRTLNVNPVANQFGTTTITVTVTDTEAGTTQSITDTFVLTVNPVADTPSVTNAATFVNTQTTSGLVISRNPVDGAEVTHFKITAITNGTLFQNDGTTQINNGDFITFAQGNVGLKFTPNSTANGSFNVQAATDGSGAGLSPAATATITVGELSASKTDALVVDNGAAGQANPGDTLEYTIVITNPVNAAAANVSFSDTPDANTDLVVGSVTTTQGTITSGNTGGDTSVGVNIGTIAALGSVTITFRASIDNPVPGGTTQIANQGTVTRGSQSVLTDDPAVGGANDPTVTPIVVNQPPTTSGIANVTVNEDAANTVINLFAAFADAEDADAALTYTIQSNDNTALFDSIAINGMAGTLTLDYKANANGVAHLTVRATDTGGAHVDAPFTVTVNAINDSPVNTVPGAQTAPGTTVVFSTGNGNAITVADVDDGDDGITGNIVLQVTLKVNHGTLTLGSTAGLTVAGNGTGTVVASGTRSNLNTGLNGLTYANNGSACSDTLTVTTNDLGHSGAGGALSDTDMVALSVADNTGPVISSASASPSSLWPPNHQMVPVTISYTATDACDASPNCTITQVTSNEAITASDYVIVDAHHVQLRAERNGGGSGRIYTITIRCTDAAGNVSFKTVQVTVPKSQGGGNLMAAPPSANSSASTSSKVDADTSD